MTPSVAKKVLVVDDHILFREGLISIFRFNPEFEVVAGAGSVREAVEKAAEYCPDIILMDFFLSDGTGIDAARAILAKQPECKIVFLTASESDENVIAAMRMGAKGYLLKNMSGADLISGLKALERDESAISRKMMNHVMQNLLNQPSAESPNQDFLQKLSARELEVLQELGTGASNSEIAQRLFLAENTVKHHIRNIFDKLEVKNRQQAAVFARRIKPK
jgi:DNA-binding NarL/FixJ family response regulator